MLYEPGETVVLIADLLPAVVEPLPDEVPQWAAGQKWRVLIFERGMVIAWQVGGTVQRRDISVATPVTATFRGGMVGPYEVRMTGGCRCGVRQLSSWDRSQIFPGTVWQQADTLSRARVDATRDSTYGLPSRRDTPTRYSRL